VGLSDFFTTTFKQGGGVIATLQSYSSGDIDYKSQLTAIRAHNPQAIFAPGYYTDIALMARQARELGMTMPILGGDGLDSPQFLKIGGKALANTYYSTHYSSDDRAPTVQSFVTHFKARYNEAPDGLAALGYDGILVLAEAMRRASSLDAKDIRNALASTQHFFGVTGRIQFDQNRNPIKSAVVLKIENEKIRYVTTVAP
jgi:branched-chain amino acid transport system substrate-binding protein